MITINDVMLDSLGNLCLLLFALLIFKQNRFAWLTMLVSVIIKVYLYGKYSLMFSLTYMSIELVTVTLACIIWVNGFYHRRLGLKRLVFALLTSAILIVIWVSLVYKFINPAILSWQFIFGFEYFCYILLIIGVVLLVYRLAFGLIFISGVFISYACYYVKAAILTQDAPQLLDDN